jgi:hypothetical protein
MCFDGMLDPTMTLDMGSLKSISWIGAKRLFEVMKKCGHNLPIQNLKYEIFRVLRLFPEFSEVFSLLSVELPFAVSREEVMNFKTVNWDLISDWLTGANFVRDDSYGKLCEPLCFALPKGLSEIYHPDLAFNSSSGDIDHDELAFWYKTYNFFIISVDLAEQLVASVSDQLIGSVEKIRLRYKNAQNAINVVDATVQLYDAEQFDDIIRCINESHEEIKALVALKKQELMRWYLNAHHACYELTEDTRSNFLDTLDHFYHITVALKEIGGKLEDFGAQVSFKIYSASTIEKLREKFGAISGDGLTPTMLEAIREHLLIMDVMSEGSWDDTKPIIIEELGAIDADIAATAVNVQGFDLARQILEHRIAEAEVFKSDLASLVTGDCYWMETKGKLMEKICAKLVTDQEKLAFDFYYREAIVELGTKKADPGDVLFF